MIKLTDILYEAKRIPRKKGQKRQSSKHSDLYTDENPKGTIHGLKFATVKDAQTSVNKIKSSGKKHAHKVQAAVAMEQRARAAGKTSAAAVYRKYINSVKKTESDLQSKLSRGHKPDYYQLHTTKFKPFDKSKDDELNEVSKDSIMDVVNKVYPQIVKDLGGRRLKVEVHNNIYRRLKAVGEEDLMKQNNPFAQYDWDKNKIYLYASAMKNVEEIIRSLLHEHTHSLQDKKKFDAGYDSGKYNYKTHPYERAATKAESKWKRYVKYLKTEENVAPNHDGKAAPYGSGYDEVDENFKDGKKKGKSRPGRVKRAGASCKGSVTDLRAKAKKYGGEKGKMYHWCANMKGGKK